MTVDSRQQVEVAFRALDVFRWEVCQVSCENATSLDEILARFGQALRRLMEQQEGRPLGLRVRLEGATAVHQEVTSHRVAVTAEIRSMATTLSDGKVWIEKVKIGTCSRQQGLGPSQHAGPLGELERYLEEIPNSPEALASLVSELKDLAKKLPGEMMQAPEGLLLDNPAWVRELIQDLRPMLFDRFQQ